MGRAKGAGSAAASGAHSQSFAASAGVPIPAASHPSRAQGQVHQRTPKDSRQTEHSATQQQGKGQGQIQAQGQGHGQGRGHSIQPQNGLQSSSTNVREKSTARKDAPSSSAAAARPRQAVLPARRHGSRIMEKVETNPVTLILGETGSGKSSQVPQMLLEAGMGPVLCTQPRRLAVVAVAKRVAEEMGCVLGTDVGYHIGQRNLTTPNSSIVFATAGVLLEELRSQGARALARYRCVVLDEVHERSVESDLVLACVKMLMLKGASSRRLVLMSATAEFQRLADYFRDLGQGERVQLVTIPSVATQLQNAMFQTQVKFLDTVVGDLGRQQMHLDVLAAIEKLSPTENLSFQGPAADGKMHLLLRDLILHLHSKQADRSKSILVFLPTYRALEEQWGFLESSPTASSLLLYVLHSSIDTDTCIKAMESAPTSHRKVILATNVAESSVTIPGVAYVVDTCTTLVLRWDRTSRRHVPHLKWASISQLDQRKGRTGRTCSGVVYRLVPRRLQMSFPRHDLPAMQLLSLRKQTLMLACAESKAINDPHYLFSVCMDPPSEHTVSDAVDFLQRIEALKPQADRGGRHVPTDYGKILVALPLSLEAAMVVVRGGMEGVVREAALLAAMVDATPTPIIHPFGKPEEYKRYLEKFQGFPQDVLPREITNMVAYEFWEQLLLDKGRADALVAFAQELGRARRGGREWQGPARKGGGNSERQLAQGASGAQGARGARGAQGAEGAEEAQDAPLFCPLFSDWCQDGVEHPSLVSEEEEALWCAHHHLIQTSVRAIQHTVNTIMEALHRIRPSLIGPSYPLPHSFTAPNAQRPSGAPHVCRLEEVDPLLAPELGMVGGTTQHPAAESGHHNDPAAAGDAARHACRPMQGPLWSADAESVALQGQEALSRECAAVPYTAPLELFSAFCIQKLGILLREAKVDPTQVQEWHDDPDGQGGLFSPETKPSPPTAAATLASNVSSAHTPRGSLSILGDRPALYAAEPYSSMPPHGVQATKPPYSLQIAPHSQAGPYGMAPYPAAGGYAGQHGHGHLAVPAAAGPAYRVKEEPSDIPHTNFINHGLMRRGSENNLGGMPGPVAGLPLQGNGSGYFAAPQGHGTLGRSGGSPAMLGYDSKSSSQSTRSPMPLCKFFALGKCSHGSSCRFSHSLFAPRPVCQFFATLQGCKFGDSCQFAHSLPQSSRPMALPSSLVEASTPAAALERGGQPVALTDLIWPKGASPATVSPAPQKVLIIGDATLSFSMALVQAAGAPQAHQVTVATHKELQALRDSPAPRKALAFLSAKGVPVLAGVKLDELTSCSVIGSTTPGAHPVQGPGGPAPGVCTWPPLTCVVWNFPRLTVSTSARSNQRLLRRAFQCLAVAFLAFARPSCRLLITLSNGQFSRWKVEQIARGCFFFLESSVEYDLSAIPCYDPLDGDPHAPSNVEDPVCYVFRAHPPPEHRFGNCRDRVARALLAA